MRSPLGVLAAREARGGARLLVGLALALAGVAYLATAGFPGYRDRLLANIAHAPPFLRQLLKARAGHVTFETGALMLYFHPVVLAVMALWPVQRASRAIAGEIARGGLGWKLAYPIGRTRYVLGHALVLLAGCAALQLVLFAALRLGFWRFGLENAGVAPYWWCALALGLLYGAIGMLTLAVSAASSRPGVPATAGAALVFGGVILANVGSFWPLVERAQWLSPYHYVPISAMLQGAPLGWRDALVLGGLALFGLIAAIVGFNRRDLSI